MFIAPPQSRRRRAAPLYRDSRRRRGLTHRAPKGGGPSGREPGRNRHARRRSRRARGGSMATCASCGKEIRDVFTLQDPTHLEMKVKGTPAGGSLAAQDSRSSVVLVKDD